MFSNKLEVEGNATAQGASGRCWVFAALNIMRQPMMVERKLSKSFELSQTYLYFYDKLERANFFLENILSTLDEPLEGRLVAHLLTEPVNDGGQWDMSVSGARAPLCGRPVAHGGVRCLASRLVNLLIKYGIVPRSAYDETKSSGASRRMNQLVTYKLREYAKRLRGMSHEGAAEGELRAEKGGMLEEVSPPRFVFRRAWLQRPCIPGPSSIVAFSRCLTIHRTADSPHPGHLSW